MNEPYPDEVPPGSTDGQPTWVKIFAIIIGVVLIFGVIGAIAYAVANRPAETETPAFIDLTVPADGATLDASQIITVSGIAAVKGGNLVVQAMDQAGNILTQQAVVVDGTNTAAGNPGTWVAQVSVNVPVTTAGRIRAYAVSPTDGSVSTEDSISVTYNLAPVIQPYIKILLPAAGSSLDTSAPITVSGDGAGLFEGGLVVQALGQNGAVLAQSPATINAPQAGLGMAGPWSTTLTVSGITSGAPGSIYAFSTSAVDGSVIAQDKVSVTYTAKVQPFITILSPANGATLDPALPIKVSGQGASLPQNQVTVQVKDQSGNLLAQQPAPLDAAGNWTAQLQVSANPNTPATIYAYAANPVDSSVVAQATISVMLATGPTPTFTGVPATPTSSVPFPTETPPPPPTATPVPTNAPTPAPIPPQASNYLWVMTQINNQLPVPGSLVTLQFSGYNASGTAGCNSYSTSVQYSGTSLTFTNIAAGKKSCSAPAGVMQQESAYLNTLAQVRSFRADQGQLLLLDQSGQLILAYQAAVIGRVFGPEGVVLPPGSQVLTAVTNTSTGAVLGKQPQANYSVFPVPFAVAYNPASVDPNQTYAVQVMVMDGSGNTLFTNHQVYPVITQGNPSFVDVTVSAP